MAAGVLWSLVARGSAAKDSDASFRFRHFKGSGRFSFLTNGRSTPLPLQIATPPFVGSTIDSLVLVVLHAGHLRMYKNAI